MIQFCDKEVYTIYEDTINRGQLFSFFCKPGNNTSIVVVLDNENKFLGIITYDLLLNSNNTLGCIQREKVILNKKIWKSAKNIFNQNEDIIYLPVFNEKDELIYFCYNYIDLTYYKYIEYIFDKVENNQEYLFIQETYPLVQAICIYGFNEWAYRTYIILKNRGIPVITIGILWKDFGIVNTESLGEYPDYSIMNIYAEGTELVSEEKDRTRTDRFKPCYGFNFLIHIGRMNTLHIENIIIQKAIELKRNWYSCSVPGFNELTHHSLEEFYRNRSNFFIQNKKLNHSDKLVKEQFLSVFGEPYEVMINKLEQEVNNKRNLNIMELEDINIIGKKYGTGSFPIYFVGPCIVDGAENLEKNQFAYLLFRILEKLYPQKFSLITIPIYQTYFKATELALEQLLNIKESIVVLISEKTINVLNSISKDSCIDLNLVDLYNIRPLEEAWFSDMPIHTNGAGNRAIAKEVFDKLLEPVLKTIEFSESDEDSFGKYIQMTKKEKKELDNYLETIKKNGFDTKVQDKVGAIVMNCNPFTKGHLYLIEEARKQVDFLYIFVVEENRSFFPFEDRLALVKQGVFDFDNVKVFPSGKFILSYNTLPSYFAKDEIQDITIDATLDIRIFAEYIAPALNISIRFVGEEPLENITNQYNREMEQTLNQYNIEFVEILRKKSEEEVISASRVRKLLKTNSFEEIKKLVPSCTYEYLISRYVE